MSTHIDLLERVPEAIRDTVEEIILRVNADHPEYVSTVVDGLVGLYEEHGEEFIAVGCQYEDEARDELRSWALQQGIVESEDFDGSSCDLLLDDDLLTKYNEIAQKTGEAPWPPFILTSPD